MAVRSNRDTLGGGQILSISFLPGTVEIGSGIGIGPRRTLDGAKYRLLLARSGTGELVRRVAVETHSTETEKTLPRNFAARRKSFFRIAGTAEQARTGWRIESD